MKVGTRSFLQVFILVQCLVVFGCSSARRQNETEIALNSNESVPSQIEAEEIKSVIEENNDTGWRVTPIPTDTRDYIKKIHFVDESHGYFITPKGLVFKTSDGGNSWDKTTSMPDETLTDVFFISQNEGFAISLKLTPERTVAASLLLKTEDEGKSWKPVLESNGVIFETLAFNGEGTGVIAGRRDVNVPKPDALNFILISSDRGENWADVSENINQLIPLRPMARDSAWRVSDYLKDVNFPDVQSIAVISDRGKIYESEDFGKSWNIKAGIKGEAAQTAIKDFGQLAEGKFWMSGNACHGTCALILVLNDGRIVKFYRLSGYNFSQVKFISKDEAIAVGAVISPNNLGGSNELNKGVVLYSNNSGKNWAVIHRSNSANEFTSIVETSEGKFFVTGANGNLLLMERNR